MHTPPGVVVLSWYPPGVGDDHGEPSEDLVPAVMDAAHRHRIKVTGERRLYPVRFVMKMDVCTVMHCTVRRFGEQHLLNY